MIPYKYIKLDEIPLNANGKVDINLITEINEEDIPVTVTPTQVTVTPIEKKMKEIWENALKTNDIGINDDFFYLGGDSITAQRIGRKILEQFGVKISFTTIINEGNIRNLSLIIESKLNENNIEENILEEVAITNTKEEIMLDKDILHLKKKVIKENKNNVIDIEIPKEYPLTGVQLAYLNGKNDNFELGKYNAHYYFEVETSFDTYKLQQAIEKLVKRHEILHSIFLREGIQKVLEKIPKYEVEVIDVTNSPEDEQEKININIRKELSHKIYDHEKWPMFDFKVLEKGNDKRILFVSIDLMICDGDSLQIMLSELAKYVEDDSVNEELNYSYGQYVMELLQSKENEEYYAAKEYWQSKLNSLPEFPQVPMTQKISLCKDYTINRKHKTIPYNNWQKIKSIAKTKRVSPSALLCAIYGMVLSKWSNQLDLVLNMTVFERKPFHEDVEKLVGDFTKLVPLEVHINSENIWDIAKDVQNEILTDLEYLAYDGTELMREIAKSQGSLGKALMPVVFTCILFDSPTNYFNQLGELQYAVSQTPQVLIDNQIIEMEGELNISWDYVEQLFDPEIMENIFNEFIDTINSISENDVIYIENSQEIIKLWDEYNDTTKEYIPTTLQKLFEDQVKESPLATAITYKNKNYSYELIDKKANQVARYLCANGICGSNTRVAVLALRKPETIISILGILKTGAAYVPIDPKFPKERREYIIQDSNCSMYLDNSLYESTKLNDYQDTSLGIVTNPNSLAYIIYTSGSTGMPKGVMIEHFAVCNTIQDINEKIDLSSKDCLIGISSICFDLSVYDLFGTFSKGARLVIVEDPRNSIEITEILSREKVTVWNSVPIIFSMVLNHIKTTESKNEFNLRQILLSGDWIPLEIPSLSKKIFGDGEVMSLGGATEGSIWSIYYNINEVNTSWKSIPYGMPLRNQTMLVLDYNLNLCPPGVKGDIFIGGVGVAKGYNNDIVKTEAAFITHREFGKIYKTGDIGIFHKEGYIEFIGRVDNQIKIRGYRVELGEIESVLAQQEEISEIVVLPVNSANNSKQLVAYFVSDNNEDIDVTIIKERISTFLPDYMIPSKFVQLSNIPITNNGKVDRKNLPLPDENMNNNDDYESPKTELQKKLVEIWKDIFELDIIGIKDDFYNLGGDSIILMKMIDRISSELSANISIEDILDSETIENLSDLINKEYDYSA
jgi:amino acid adenylation domain-containing protein